MRILSGEEKSRVARPVQNSALRQKAGSAGPFLDRTGLVVMPPRNQLANLQIKYVSVLKWGAKWLDGHGRKVAVAVQFRRPWRRSWPALGRNGLRV
jgi:hypothetical protein